MKCRKCGAILVDGANFCCDCGAKVEIEINCENCGTKLQPEAKFCFNCGSKVDNAEAKKSEVKIEIQHNEHSHGKEFYRFNSFCVSDNNNKIDFKKSVYADKIYYLYKSYLFCSDLDRKDIQIVTECNYHGGYIHVNCTGIYLYSYEQDLFVIKRIDFKGNLLSEYEESGEISHIYIYDDQIYYVYNETGKYGNDQIKCLDSNSKRSVTVYDKASGINGLYANDSYLVFNADYCNYDGDNEVEYDGWMFLSLNDNTRSPKCLSSADINPEIIIDNPNFYIEKGYNYYDINENKRKIVFFDLKRDIFWVESDIKDNTEDSCYWEPRSIFDNYDENVPNIAVWKTPWKSSVHFSSREYFDGKHHYVANNHHRFAAIDKLGNIYDWGIDLHGVCNEFTVANDLLFLDLDHRGEDQYELSTKETKPLRNYKWSGDITYFNEHNHIIDAYKNTKLG